MSTYAALEWLRDRYEGDPGSLIGCTTDEIAEIERLAGARLPTVYREFMAMAGKRAGAPLTGTDYGYPTVLKLRSWALELLSECQVDYVLPANMFVFAMHQGYEFASFVVDATDDPPVYQFVEGEGQPRIEWESFSTYLRDVLQQRP